MEKIKNIYCHIVEELPFAAALYVGREMRISQANQSILAIWGKDKSVIGMTFREMLPELKGQPFFKLYDDVFTSGITYRAKEKKVELLRNGILQTFYLNFSYIPLKNEEGQIWGVLTTANDVTELVLTKQILDNEKESTRLALNAAELGTWVLDPLKHTVSWDARCRELFGYDEQDLVRYAEVFKHIHPSDKELVSQAIAVTLNPDNNGLYDVKFKTIGKDKVVRWLRCKGKAYFNSDGKAYRFAGTAQDVTDDNLAFQEQQKLLTLVENSADMMSILENNGVNSYINKAGRDLLGFDNLEQVVVTPISELHRPEDFAVVEKQVLPSLAKFGRWAGKMLVRNFKTHEIIPVFNNTIRIDDPLTGEPMAVGALMRDLRPEMAAQKAMAQSEKLFREITTAAPTALWMADENLLITFVNQIWIDWTGQPLEKHLGEGWLDKVHDADRPEMVRQFLEDAEKRKKHESQFRIKSKDGSFKWVICTGNPQYRDNGTFSGYIGACVDITELKQLQNQKDEFLGIASHELKTPVTSIKAYAQILESIFRESGDQRKADMLKKMDMQVNRLTNLIGDLLDVTKIQTGKIQFNSSAFNFNELVHELVEDLQRTTKKHTIVEQISETGIIHADRERVGQVITNLLTNAIKYSPDADKIIVFSRLEDEEIRLCVQDFGIGIPGDKKDKVFEQFYRVSGDKQRTFPGLGLGLYISSEIITREGGRIWVNSKPGEGSTFCFSLPVNKKISSV